MQDDFPKQCTGKMQRSFLFSGIKVPRGAATNISCSALYSNPLGLHSNVWMGAWDKKAAKKSIEQTKELGYNLIEGRDMLQLVVRLLLVVALE